MSGLERVSGKKFTDLLRSAENGDMESLKLLDEAATYLAQWIANMAIAYDPPTIILYGEMLDLCKNMFDRITERYINYLWTPGNYDLKVRKLSIKNGNVPYLAGAANVFHQFINPDVTIHT
jgi:predicted NBD/HSP70 family sugar kinase